MTASKAPKPRAPRKPATKPKAKPAAAGQPKNKGGRPRIPFDGTDSDKVRLLARVGTKQEIIAGLLGCSVDTLQRRFVEELTEGHEHAEALIASTLFTKALDGDTTAIIWWEKTRRGLREITAHEHSGPGGKPIQLQDMSHYSDEQLDILERAASILAGSAAQPDG